MEGLLWQRLIIKEIKVENECKVIYDCVISGLTWIVEDVDMGWIKWRGYEVRLTPDHLHVWLSNSLILTVSLIFHLHGLQRLSHLDASGNHRSVFFYQSQTYQSKFY